MAGADVSIADLVLAAEVAQLELLAAAPGGVGPRAAELLAPHARVATWLRAVEAATAPHWGEAHAAMQRAAEARPPRAPAAAARL